MAERTWEGLLPPAGHKDLAKEIYKLVAAIVKDKSDKQLDSKWFRFYELGKNRHWRSTNPNLSLLSANLLHTHRRRTINELTDNNPTFNVRRVVASESTEDKFKLLVRTVDYWWREEEQQDIFELSVHNGETYGVCVEKMTFNLELNYGIGEAETVVVDPFHFGVYPTNSSSIQKAQAALHYYPLPVSELKRMYPKFKDEIRPDEDLINSLGKERETVHGMKETMGRSGSGSVSFLSSVRKLLSPDGGALSDNDSKEAVIVECWVKDYTRVPVDKEDKSKGDMPKYKGHIRCITCVNGTIVLSDRDNPSINPNVPQELAMQTYLWDKFPFAKANSNKDPVSFWGESDFEQLSGLQMEINKAISQFASLKDKVAGVKIINPKTSGVADSKFQAGVTIINPDVALHGIGYMEPPPIPKELVEGLTIFKELFFTISGTFDLEQANTPGSQVIAYKAIAALLERASTMKRGKIRNYSQLIRERGRMYVSMAQNWYTEKRYITFMDGDDEVQTEVLGKEMIVPMKLTVVNGSTMPISKVQQREEALNLFDKGAIDQLELLTAMEWPKASDVVKRMQQGPVGKFIDSLVSAGMPDEIAEYMGQISVMDDRELARAIDRHEIPFFVEAFQFQGVGNDPKRKAELTKLQAEVDEIYARIDKIKADRDKVVSDIEVDAENVKQGYERNDLTKKQIDIDRTKVIHQSRIDRKKLEIDKKRVEDEKELRTKEIAASKEKSDAPA